MLSKSLARMAGAKDPSCVPRPTRAESERRPSDANATVTRTPMESKLTALAAELRLLMRLAARDPEALVGNMPVLSSFAQVRSRALEPDSLEAVLFIIERLVPDLLARLPDGPDSNAIRELFVWEEPDGQSRNLTTRYHLASRHLIGAALDFGRRQEPRLLKECARRFLSLDFEDAESLAASTDTAVTAFWGLEHSAGVQLVFPELPVQERIRHGDLASRDHLRLARFTDLDTLLDLRSFFAREYPRVLVEEATWTDISPPMLRRDFVNVGGVHYNGLTAQLLNAVGSPFSQLAAPDGTPDALVDNETGAQFVPEYSAGELVAFDYGLFLRAPNPYDPRRWLIIVNGVLTHGVLGASRAFTDPEEARKNIEAVSQLAADLTRFAVLIRVSVVANTVPAPKLSGSDLVLVRELVEPS